MTKPVKLTLTDIDTALGILPNWTLKNGNLHRQYEFADFAEAFGFMTSVALIAQRMDHHPAWSNVWNKVSIELYTHDAEGITDADVKLAHHAEQLASRQLGK
jgi:4a-hydroxytetrahydrobiopterin dehydratase